MLLEDIKDEDLWKFFKISGSIVAIQELVNRHHLVK